ncbi:hypothetical protein SAY86_003134 [Trapa natans]|uniref:DUF868 domain-containing protein n=1 Tax=Trapa natans TaxID=22666 RepID=A0AAN7LS38_TRANT|nr:hypothetical protein SAY86_003134 [Trapa natans]
MRDRFSCFSQNSVSFSQPSSFNASSSSVSSSPKSSSSAAPPSLLPSIRDAVTCVYRTLSPSTQKPLFISLSWLWSLALGQSSLTVGFGLEASSSSSTSFKLIGSSSRLFNKHKGSKKVELGESRVEVFWDFSNARFDSGPEPLDGFYILVVIDSQLRLFLGDMADEAIDKKFKRCNRSKFSLVSRRENCSGNAHYGTRCQFGETGVIHDIVIRIGAEAEGPDRDSTLSVYIDKKKVMRVKRLLWNFRGSQTIFLDGTGLMMDMLWDVHDWFFGESREGRGVFMFATRTGLLSGRYWAEGDGEDEKPVVEKSETDHRANDFSLLIYATKNS